MKWCDIKFFFVCAAGLCCYDVCFADIYKYVDKNGVVHFSNTPNRSDYRLVLKDRKSIEFREKKYGKIITDLCRKYNMDVPLVKAVIKAESDYNPIAVSKKGAVGMMQLMPGKAKELSVSDPYDPYQNIVGGIRHLRGLLDRFKGDITLALAAYNAGENAVLKDNRVPPFRETQNYIKKVLKFKKYYR